MASEKLILLSTAAALVIFAFSLSLLAGASAVYAEKAQTETRASAP